MTVFTVKANEKTFSFSTLEEAIEYAKKLSRMFRNNAYYVYQSDCYTDGYGWRIYRVVNDTATDVSYRE